MTSSSKVSVLVRQASGAQMQHIISHASTCVCVTKCNKILEYYWEVLKR